MMNTLMLTLRKLHSQQGRLENLRINEDTLGRIDAEGLPSGRADAARRARPINPNGDFDMDHRLVFVPKKAEDGEGDVVPHGEPAEAASTTVAADPPTVTTAANGECLFAEAWHKRRFRPPFKEYGKANAPAAAGALVCGCVECSSNRAVNLAFAVDPSTKGF